jgi:hypothetical protein
MNGCKKRKGPHPDKNKPLKYTQGTGIQVINILIIQGKTQQ